MHWLEHIVMTLLFLVVIGVALRLFWQGIEDLRDVKRFEKEQQDD